MPRARRTRAVPSTSSRAPLIRAVLLGLVAAMLHGSWALYANFETGRGARSALAQACISFTNTMGLTLFTEWLFRFGKTPRRGFWIAAMGTFLLMAGATVGLHAVVGTPRLLVTIAPSVTFGAIFFTSYAWGLRVAAERKSP